MWPSAGVLLAFIIAACAASAPTPAPGDFGDAMSALVLRGVTVVGQTSGDAGCQADLLHRNAARLAVSVAGDEAIYDVYLFRWRRDSDFTAAAPSFAACLDEHSDRAGLPVMAVESSPWRAYGTGWSNELRAVVEQALRAAGGN